MNKTIDPENEAYFKANIKFADACHRMSEIYEEWSGKGFESTKLSGLKLALGWENLAVESRRRYQDTPENIITAENNIQRIKQKIKKYQEERARDNKFGNT